MMKKRNNDDVSGGAPEQSAEKPAEKHHSPGEAQPGVRMITSKDKGWITPTAFVAPITMVPIDSPRPLKKPSPPPAD